MKLVALVIALCVAPTRPAEACSKVACPAPMVAFASADEAVTSLAAADVAIVARAIYTLAASDKPDKQIAAAVAKTLAELDKVDAAKP